MKSKHSCHALLFSLLPFYCLAIVENLSSIYYIQPWQSFVAPPVPTVVKQQIYSLFTLSL